MFRWLVDEIELFFYQNPRIYKAGQNSSIGRTLRCPCDLFLVLAGYHHFGRISNKSKIAERKRMTVIKYEHGKNKRMVLGQRATLMDGTSSLRGKLFGNRGAASKDQYNSALFSKLPTEIRLQIWECIVSDSRAIHMELVLVGLFFHLDLVWCEQPINLHKHRVDCSIDPTPLKRGIVPLLMTCRRIYSEVMPIIYTKNHFAFRGVPALRIFAAMSPTEYFREIRHLSLPFLHNHEMKRYSLVKILGSLKGLRVLCLGWQPPTITLPNNAIDSAPSFSRASDQTKYSDIRAVVPIQCRVFCVEALFTSLNTTGSVEQEARELGRHSRELLDESEISPVVLELLVHPPGTLILSDQVPFELPVGRKWYPKDLHSLSEPM